MPEININSKELELVRKIKIEYDLITKNQWFYDLWEKEFPNQKKDDLAKFNEKYPGVNISPTGVLQIPNITVTTLINRNKSIKRIQSVGVPALDHMFIAYPNGTIIAYPNQNIESEKGMMLGKGAYGEVIKCRMFSAGQTVTDPINYIAVKKVAGDGSHSANEVDGLQAIGQTIDNADAFSITIPKPDPDPYPDKDPISYFIIPMTFIAGKTLNLMDTSVSVRECIARMEAEDLISDPQVRSFLITFLDNQANLEATAISKGRIPTKLEINPRTMDPGSKSISTKNGQTQIVTEDWNKIFNFPEVIQIRMKSMATTIREEKKNKIPSPSIRLALAIRALEKLQELHNTGRLNLDFKGENVIGSWSIINGILTIKAALIDLGTARQLPDGKDSMQILGPLLGSPAHMAPNIKSPLSSPINSPRLTQRRVSLPDNPVTYSKATDIYAFLRSLELDFGVALDIAQRLIADYGTAGTMPAIDEIKKTLILELIKAAKAEAEAEAKAEKIDISKYLQEFSSESTPSTKSRPTP